jgi:ABC-type antimicrobial peptide transport system permease subunit
MGSDEAPLIEVIGVVGSTRSASLSKPASPDVYFPYWQDDMSVYSDRLTLIVRSPSSGIVAVRNVLGKLDPRMPWPEVRSLDDIVNVSLAPRRFQRNVIVLMALVATLLTFVGIYGVISHRVALRTKEVGIRMVLGARIGSVQGLVFRHSLKFVLAGTALGAVAAVPLMRLLGSLVFAIDQQGMVLTFLLCVLIGLATAVAAHLPVRRLVQLDPVVALRAE